MKKHVKRNYKDTVFHILFSGKDDLLELYNAVNNTNYTNSDKLEIMSLDDAIYIGLKNDISFIVSSRLNIYEHQSTLCMNMPLRGLFYISDLYKKYVIEPELLYRQKLYKIPTPEYVVFYNGNKYIDDITEMKLSHSFIISTDNPALEVKAKIININMGHNKKILESCSKLNGYAILVNYIKENRKTMILEDAVNLAVERCIKENVLKEFLERHKAEVSEVFLAQYNEERMRELIKEDSYEEGLEQGLENGLIRGRIESTLELLGELGEIPEALKENLLNETDMLRLKEMHKYAAKAESIDDFMKRYEL